MVNYKSNPSVLSLIQSPLNTTARHPNLSFPMDLLQSVRSEASIVSKPHSVEYELSEIVQPSRV